MGWGRRNRVAGRTARSDPGRAARGCQPPPGPSRGGDQTLDWSGETFENLPELDRAELVEAVGRFLLAPFEEDPGRTPGSLVRHEVHPPTDQIAMGPGFEQDPPIDPPTGQIAHVAARGGLSRSEEHTPE